MHLIVGSGQLHLSWFRRSTQKLMDKSITCPISSSCDGGSSAHDSGTELISWLKSGIWRSDAGSVDVCKLSCWIMIFSLVSVTIRHHQETFRLINISKCTPENYMNMHYSSHTSLTEWNMNHQLLFCNYYYLYKMLICPIQVFLSVIV